MIIPKELKENIVENVKHNIGMSSNEKIVLDFGDSFSYQLLITSNINGTREYEWVRKLDYNLGLGV